MARVNYIQNMKKQYGDNWINLLRPEDIQRSAKRVFKEMIRNQIDYEKDGNWFNEAKFLDNLIIAAQNECRYLLFSVLSRYSKHITSDISFRDIVLCI